MPPLTLKAGDVVLFPHGDAHTMASPNIIDRELLDLRSLLDATPRELELGGGGAPTRFICGYLACDPVLCRSLLAALPKVLAVSLRDNAQSEWIERSFVHAVDQAGAQEPGGHGVLAKLSELLVVDLAALRRPCPGASDRIACRPARSDRLPLPGADPWMPGASLDAREPGPRGGKFAIRAGR